MCPQRPTVLAVVLYNDIVRRMLVELPWGLLCTLGHAGTDSIGLVSVLGVETFRDVTRGINTARVAALAVVH